MKTLSLDIEPSLFERALEVMRTALKSVDKNATLSCDSDEYLSKADQEELKEIYELTKAGKMEFYELCDVFRSTEKIIEKYQ